MYIWCTQFPIRFMQFWIFNFQQIYTIHRYNVHNFPWNLCNSRYSIFYKSRQSVHLMYTISRWIHAILDIQFSANPDNLYIKCTQFPMEFTQFRIFNFSANPDNPYKLCVQFLIEFMHFWMFNFSVNPKNPYICTQFLIEFTQFWIFNFSSNPDIP